MCRGARSASDPLGAFGLQHITDRNGARSGGVLTSQSTNAKISFELEGRKRSKANPRLMQMSSS